MMKYKPLDFSKVKTIDLRERENLVKVSQFAKPFDVEKIRSRGDSSSLLDFLDALPAIGKRTNAAAQLKSLVYAIDRASINGKPISWGLGPHIIKYGLSPLVIQLMDLGFVSAIAMNGAGAIHDTEIAMIGETSEEMTGEIETGRFGMARQTGEFINSAAAEAASKGIGFGEALGRKILEENLPYADYSLYAASCKREINATVHVGIGTDIIHTHPCMDGAATGAASFTDFRRLAGVIAHLGNGGVHLNIGSSVILPECFLKALTVANNLGFNVRGFVTANIDHLSEYRPLMNVVRRPVHGAGEGYEIVGRMEIMAPLLVRLLVECKIARSDGCFTL